MNDSQSSGYVVLNQLSIGDVRCKCGRCNWTGLASGLAPVKACELRPGDISPAGRCPKCFDLAYPDRQEDREAAYASTLHEVLTAMLLIQERLDKGRPVQVELISATLGRAREVKRRIKGGRATKAAEPAHG